MRKKKRTKKVKEVVKYVHDHIYGCDFTLYIGTPEGFKEWARNAMMKDKYLSLEKMLTENPLGGQLQGRTYGLGGGGVSIYMPEWKEDVFVHELFHTAFNVFEAKDTPINRDTEEPFAYLLQFLYKNLKP